MTIIFLFNSRSGFAQVVKYSNEFLELGVGARNIAQGEANSAAISDASAIIYNPACLLNLDHKLDITAMHNEQFAGIGKHDFLAAAYKPKANEAIAAGFTRYGIDNIPNTLYLMSNGQIDYSKLKLFSAVDYAFFVSYARALKKEGLSAGVTAKVIRRVIGEFANAWGFGFDASIQYNKNKWKLACIAKDITSTFDAWSMTLSESDKAALVSTGNAIPGNSIEVTLPHINLAASRKWRFYKNKASIQPNLGIDFYSAGQRNVLVSSKYFNADPKAGLELAYLDMLYVRCGINRIQQLTSFDGNTTLTYNPSIGAGIYLKKIALDYAISNPSATLLGASNIVSMRLFLDDVK